jgi:hypothetical protein
VKQNRVRNGWIGKEWECLRRREKDACAYQVSGERLPAAAFRARVARESSVRASRFSSKTSLWSRGLVCGVVLDFGCVHVLGQVVNPQGEKVTKGKAVSLPPGARKRGIRRHGNVRDNDGGLNIPLSVEAVEAL